jgi:hypothetical protein
LIRPIGPEDRERLKEGFESASAESILLRFLAPHPQLTSSQLDYLTAIDHVRHEALIAVDPDSGESFGTARFVRPDARSQTAEFAIGIGEAPLGLQGTFSVWDSSAALAEYAYRRTSHREAIRETERSGWYTEELCARFALVQTTGTLAGADPLGATL